MKKSKAREILLTLPSFGWMVVFFLLPSILLFTLSFRPPVLGGRIGDGWTFETWMSISNPSYPDIVWRTVWLSFLYGHMHSRLCAMCLCGGPRQ